MKFINSFKLLNSEILKNLFFKSNLFKVGLLLKVILSLCFSSLFLSDLFLPFVKYAVSHNILESYKDYYAIKSNAFPYPPLMLYILAIPEYIYTFLRGNVDISFIDLLVIRIPLIIADFIILLILIKLLRNTKQILIWYWFNPIVIYISYIHGQLDIIPTAFLFLSLYFLFNNRLVYFLLFLAVSCSIKFHIIIVVPFVIIYLLKSRKISYSQLLKGSLAFSILLFLFNFPFIFQNEFIQMVYNNSEQGKVFASFLNIFENYTILLIPAFYIILLYLFMDFNFINRDILFIFLALSFGIFTFFTVPGQGWYLWNMPFLVYFIIRFKLKSQLQFVFLNVSYFLFFLFYSKSDFPLVAQFINPNLRNQNNLYQYLKLHFVNADVIVQITFTLLEVSLLLFCLSILRTAVSRLRGLKIYHHPYVIGICGDSGSGKSTITSNLEYLFGIINTVTVKGDDMHKWERGHDKWKEFTHLNPKANWIHNDLSQLLNLKSGNKILRRSYDHDTGKFTEEKSILPNKIIIYEGLHSFYLKETSKVYDLKIFMKPSETLRKFWKVKRDVLHRGYSVEKVLSSLELRKNDSLNHILSQEVEADIVFSIENSSPIDYSDIHADPQIQLRILCSNDIYFEKLIDCLIQNSSLLITHDINITKQEILINGVITKEEIQYIALILILDIEELTGSAPIWSDNFEGLMQLFLLFNIFVKLRQKDVLFQ